MTDKTGAAATDAGADPATESAATTASAPTRPGRPGPAAGGPLWLAVPALLWLIVMLQSVRVALGSAGAGALNVIEAAIGLPAVVAAALVGGAAVGLTLVRLAARYRSDRSGLRFAVALGAGLLTGVASAAVIITSHATGGPEITVLAAVIAAAATIGGAVAGVRASSVVAAGVAASLGVFLLTGARALFDSELLDLLGAADSPASVLAAQQRIAWVASGLSGLVAGLIAFAYLRRATRSAATPPRTAAYLTAGGSVGAMLLITEVITRVGGARLLDVARSLSESDKLFQDLADAARLTSALTVFFVGALTAMIGYGRTLRPAPEQPDEN
ncbi:MAG TPA: hypothetical protein VFX61_10730 [Micromonosporaceae bacterium]|nr:hypothetical protein [Micromonosporaceae bacterium]